MGEETDRTFCWLALWGARRWGGWVLYGAAAAALGAAAAFGWAGLSEPDRVAAGAGGAAAEAVGEHEQDQAHSEAPSGHIRLSRAQQQAGGVRTALVERGDLTTFVRVTGKVAFNEDRLTRLHPLVEGRVHEVRVKFGDRVRAGQVVAVIDSQEVGRAKLELYKSIQAAELARVNFQWRTTVYENTLKLIDALRQGASVNEIEQAFRGKAMGEYRSQLVGAYADLQKAQADYDRLADVAERGVVAGKQLLAAKAARDAAQAKFASALEQIGFVAERDKIAAEQALREAVTTVSINKELLVILGYPEQFQEEDIDPEVQGEAISHYEVRAPFDGVVIGKDVVLRDYVDPTVQMFTIADLRSVWLTADVYEQYLGLLASLKGQAVRFRAAALPGRVFEAVVFYTGSQVDEETRTADVRAIAENPDGALKAGMFVQIELPEGVAPDVVQVPTAAVAEEEGEAFVFVQLGDEEFERRDVVLGRRGGGMVEIVEGVEPGEKVVVAGLFALKSAAQGELEHAHVH